MIKYVSLFSTLLFLSASSFAAPSLPPLKIEKMQFETAAGQTIPFEVEIADTEPARQNGLMFRDSLKPNTGMLFIFDTPSEPMFWMKDAKIRLDLIYIGEDGIVKGVHANAIPFDLTPIPAPARVIAVLEIAGGTAETLGISKGAKAIHSIFKKDAK